MSQRDGFFYYYSDYLGLETDNLLIQYDAGFLDNYSGCGHPEFDRSNINFPQEIPSATGLNSPAWTHFFVYNKTQSGQGVLFSSLQGNYPYSGYAIGVTDDNKVYFETYDNTGPVVRVGHHINSPHNAIGVTLINNSVSFNYFDFDKQETESESFPIQSQFVLPHKRAFLGGSPVMPAYTSGAKFPGTIDNYIYVADSIAPEYFSSLFSGFYSYYDQVPGPVTTGSYQEVTGYNEVETGHSGVTGYQITSGIVGTGQDGQPIYQFGATPLSGFIVDAIIYQPLTGTIYTYTTGDPVEGLVVDTNFSNTFTYDRVTILAPPVLGDMNFFYGSPTIQAGNFNLRGDYNFGEGSFDLQSVYNDQEVQLFLNGKSLANEGYSVTGNVYASGFLISGDYFLQDFRVVTKNPIPTSYTGYAYYNSSGVGIGTVTYPINNTLIYDYIPSGQKMSIPFVATSSGHTLDIGLTTGSMVFLDGVKLNYNADYKVVGNKVLWITNAYANYQGTGTLSSFYEPSSTISASGLQFGTLAGFQKDTSRVFHNGARLVLNQDYVENSHLDFLRHRTIMETGLNLLYNGDSSYFE